MNSEAAVTIDFDDVPIESMQLIDVQFKALIQDIIQEGPSFFNMNRIHTISEILLIYFSNFSHFLCSLSQSLTHDTLKLFISFSPPFFLILIFLSLGTIPFC